MTESFDILVIGAGPAGIAAALAASRSGQRVGLVDDNPSPGGQIWRSGGHLPASARRLLAQLASSSVIRLHGWRIFDAPSSTILHAERASGGAFAELRASTLILATGARERFLPFPGWTLPNVMGAGALDALVRGGLPIAGKRVVVAGTGPLLLAVAAHLARRGARILAIAEQAPPSRLLAFSAHLLRQPAKLAQGFAYRAAAARAPFCTGTHVAAAHGGHRLEAVTLRRGVRQWNLPCDYLACGFHLVPNTELPSLLGCALNQDGFVVTGDLLQSTIPGIYCAGEPTGIGGVDLALLEGRIAGLAASGRTPEARRLVPFRRASLGFVRALARAFQLQPELRSLASDATILCRCEDVSCGAVRRHANWREAKLQTRCGMGPCQGRICGAAAEFLYGWRDRSVRPPIFPALVSSLSAAPAKETP